MAFIITPHSAAAERWSQGGGTPMGMLAAQTGDSEAITTSASAAHSAAFAADTIVTLFAGEACAFRIGAGATAVATTGTPMAANTSVDRLVRKGERVSVIAR